MQRIKKHTPVMVNEVIELLNIKKNGLYIDMTFGWGGHSIEILKRLDNNGTLLSFDIFEGSIQEAKKYSKKYGNFIFYPESYVNYYKYLNNKKCDGILMDIGFSSANLECGRGFSYLNSNEKIDMRYSLRGSKTATNILNTLSINSLKNEFKKYDITKINELVSNIMYNKKNNKLTTVSDMNAIISKTYSSNNFFKMQKLIFQALRIMVNNEIENLKSVLKSFQNYLARNGRMVVISFHSLERDLIIKRFKSLVNPHPSKLPIIKEPDFELLTKHPLIPSVEEIAKNDRARSAMLMAIRRK